MCRNTSGCARSELRSQKNQYWGPTLNDCAFSFPLRRSSRTSNLKYSLTQYEFRRRMESSIGRTLILDWRNVKRQRQIRDSLRWDIFESYAISPVSEKVCRWVRYIFIQSQLSENRHIWVLRRLAGLQKGSSLIGEALLFEMQISPIRLLQLQTCHEPSNKGMCMNFEPVMSHSEKYWRKPHQIEWILSDRRSPIREKSLLGTNSA